MDEVATAKEFLVVRSNRKAKSDPQKIDRRSSLFFQFNEHPFTTFLLSHRSLTVVSHRPTFAALRDHLGYLENG